MLTKGHPHAWNVDHIDKYLTESERRRLKFTKDGHVVVTSQMRQLITGMPAALQRCAAVAVSGPYGTGKSTMLAVLAALADVNVATVNLSEDPSSQYRWGTISEAVIGKPLTGSGQDKRNAVRDYIYAVPTLLIVDEAQLLNRTALLQLRWLWDHDFPSFSVVLAGSGLFAHLDKEPSVSTRIERRIPTRLHSPERIIELVRQYSHQAATTDPAVLHWVNTTYAKGSWRLWANFLRSVSYTFDRHDAIDYDLAIAAITECTGTPPHRPQVGTR